MNAYYRSLFETELGYRAEMSLSRQEEGSRKRLRHGISEYQHNSPANQICRVIRFQT